jgi:hypothetical protein
VKLHGLKVVSTDERLAAVTRKLYRTSKIFPYGGVAERSKAPVLKVENACNDLPRDVAIGKSGGAFFATWNAADHILFPINWGSIGEKDRGPRTSARCSYQRLLNTWHRSSHPVLSLKPLGHQGCADVSPLRPQVAGAS